MGSGNCLVDSEDKESDTKYVRCELCNGDGYIPWNQVEDGSNLMKDEMHHRQYMANKHGYPIKNMRQLMAIARQVKAEGMFCDNCDGKGSL